MCVHLHVIQFVAIHRVGIGLVMAQVNHPAVCHAKKSFALGAYPQTVFLVLIQGVDMIGKGGLCRLPFSRRREIAYEFPVGGIFGDFAVHGAQQDIALMVLHHRTGVAFRAEVYLHDIRIAEAYEREIVRIYEPKVSLMVGEAFLHARYQFARQA